MTSGKRNKSAGSNWERECCKICRNIGFPHIVTTRIESRNRDAAKVDVMNSNEEVNGRFFLNIQCKTTAVSLNYGKVLGEMPDDPYINVIWHKQTRKVNERFIGIGTYAILHLDDFLDILQFLKDNNYEQDFNRRRVVGSTGE